LKPGTLYIVGTPIGNLEDVTMRALRVLREVDLIAAEDTRRTAKLLQHYSIATPATSLHEHNEQGKTPRLLEKLAAGSSIALVSDAGMPLVSDPGAVLVRAVRAAGLPVEVIPGPSAVTAVLANAGVAGPFAFLGFPPASGRARREWLGEIGHMTARLPVVLFESPHRLMKTLGDVRSLLGDGPIVVGRELTKTHQELVEQPISGFEASDVTPRGEYVLVLPKSEPVAKQPDPPSDAQLLTEFGEMTENGGLKPRAAAKALAQKYGLAASDIYRLAVGAPNQER
jgi:16S rRNA (cytidine1402-2'-O)-methyltransferase